MAVYSVALLQPEPRGWEGNDLMFQYPITHLTTNTPYTSAFHRSTGVHRGSEKVIESLVSSISIHLSITSLLDWSMYLYRECDGIDKQGSDH